MRTCLPSKSKLEIAQILRNKKGAALVEAAVILIPFLLLLLGIIEFSLVLYNQQVINNAAREGARAGIIVRQPRLSDDQIRTVVANFARDNLVTFGDDQFDDSAIVIQRDPLPINFGDRLVVSANYTYGFLVVPQLVQFLGLDFDTSIGLTATARMEME
jgi:uncharacterized membrane protein